MGIINEIFGPAKPRKKTPEEMQQELAEAKHKLEIEKINTDIAEQKEKQKKATGPEPVKSTFF